MSSISNCRDVACRFDPVVDILTILKAFAKSFHLAIVNQREKLGPTPYSNPPPQSVRLKQLTLDLN